MGSESKFHVFYKGEMAEKYATDRPPYPMKVADAIVEFLEEKMPKPHTLVVDVACGTGQGTRILSKYFDKVIGCDASPDQISVAKRTETLPNIQYCVSAAEELPAESGTVDVITVASALQFFELDKFFKEADRILKPGGILALYSFKETEVRNGNGGKRATDLILQHYQDILYKNPPAAYLNPKLVSSHFHSLEMPYDEVKRVDGIYNERCTTVRGLIELIESFSPSKEFMRKNPETGPQVIQTLKEEMLDALKVDEDTAIEIAIPLYIVMARKPVNPEE
ncbi:putative methyltransferase DDB_G0268948 [Glandiceps talaboti]